MTYRARRKKSETKDGMTPAQTKRTLAAVLRVLPDSDEIEETLEEQGHVVGAVGKEPVTELTEMGVLDTDDWSRGVKTLIQNVDEGLCVVLEVTTDEGDVSVTVKQAKVSGVGLSNELVRKFARFQNPVHDRFDPLGERGDPSLLAYNYA